MESMLIVVDMQRDFVTGALGTEEARAIVPAVAERIRQARSAGENVYFTFDTHQPGYLETAEGVALPVEHCIEGTEGHALAEGIRQMRTEGDVAVKKPTFGSEQLAELLGQAAQRGGYPDGRGLRIELCGVCTDICVITNALLIKTHLPEAWVTVQAHLCAGVTTEKHEAALMVMRSCQIHVLP